MRVSYPKKQLRDNELAYKLPPGESPGMRRVLVTYGKPEHLPLAGTYICDEKSCNHLTIVNYYKNPEVALDRLHRQENTSTKIVSNSDYRLE